MPVSCCPCGQHGEKSKREADLSANDMQRIERVEYGILVFSQVDAGRDVISNGVGREVGPNHV